MTAPKTTRCWCGRIVPASSFCGCCCANHDDDHPVASDGPSAIFAELGWPRWGRRFVERSTVDPSSGCWLWKNPPPDGRYPQINVEGRGPVAHRLLWEYVNGPVPDSLVLDHLCRVRHCVNPSHLEPVTQRVNVARSAVSLATRYAARTHCNHGHEFTPENTYWRNHERSRPVRSCRRCHLDRIARRRARERAAS